MYSIWLRALWSYSYRPENLSEVVTYGRKLCAFFFSLSFPEAWGLYAVDLSFSKLRWVSE